MVQKITLLKNMCGYPVQKLNPGKTYRNPLLLKKRTFGNCFFCSFFSARFFQCTAIVPFYIIKKNTTCGKDGKISIETFFSLTKPAAIKRSIIGSTFFGTGLPHILGFPVSKFLKKKKDRGIIVYFQIFRKKNQRQTRYVR